MQTYLPGILLGLITSFVLAFVGHLLIHLHATREQYPRVGGLLGRYEVTERESA